MSELTPPTIFSDSSDNKESIGQDTPHSLDRFSRKKRAAILVTAALVALVLLSVLVAVTIAVFQNIQGEHMRNYANHSGNAGWAKETALASWRSIEGVDRIELRTYEWKSNPYSNTLGGTEQESGTQGVIEVSIKDGYRISDGAQFLKSAASTVWALNDQSIDSISPVAVYIRGGTPVGYLWHTQGADMLQMKDILNISSAGFQTEPYRPSIAGSTLQLVSAEFIKSQFGPHIGNPPKLASSLLSKGDVSTAIDPIVSVAVNSDFSANSANRCYRISLQAPTFVSMSPNKQGFRTYQVDYIIRDQATELKTGTIDSYVKGSGAIGWSSTQLCLSKGSQLSKDMVIEFNDSKYALYRPTNAAPLENKRFILVDYLEQVNK